MPLFGPGDDVMYSDDVIIMHSTGTSGCDVIHQTLSHFSRIRRLEAGFKISYTQKNYGCYNVGCMEFYGSFATNLARV